MNLRLNEEQRILKDSARSFLARECPKQLMRDRRGSSDDYNRASWSKLSLLGWTGLFIGEYYGGVGGSFEELSLINVQLGAAFATAPILGTAVHDYSAFPNSNHQEMKTTLLPRIATGSCKHYCASGVLGPAI